MRDRELAETTRRTVETPDYEIETCVAYNYAAGPGEYQVRLNPDAQALPAPCRPYLTPAKARELAADLLAQADEADQRNGTPARPASAVEVMVDWAGRTFGQLSPAERAAVTRQAAGQLQAELTAAAPAIAKALDEAEEG